MNIISFFLKMKPEFNDRHVKTSVFHMTEITELQE